ncbi:hypothetical protein GS530_01235 [Rhodococcus hoagii]|nr:hypothetical protein [Prescottella equi]
MGLCRSGRQAAPPAYERRQDSPSPSRSNLLRLAGLALAEQHDDWIEGRRYRGLDVRPHVHSDEAPDVDTNLPGRSLLP